MNSYAVRFDFDTAEPPTEERLDEIEDITGHTVSARARRGYSVTVWVDAVDGATAVFKAQFKLNTELHEAATIIAVVARTESDYVANAFARSLPVIVGAADVADMLEVSRQRVHQLAQTPGFPDPIARIKMGPLWDEAAIMAFAARWERKPGRPARPTVRLRVVGIAPHGRRSNAHAGTSAKRAVAAKKAPVKRAVAAKKATAKRAVAAKKTTAKRAVAAKKATAKRAVAAKKTTAKRAVAAKKTTAKRAVAAKTTTTRGVTAKKTTAKRSSHRRKR